MNSESAIPGIIELSDTCIRAFSGGREVYAQPGIALLPPGGSPILGSGAQNLLRQQPTRIHSRFWTDVSTDPLPISHTSVRHSADLIWHQLAQVREHLEQSEVVLCLPSHLSRSQMQLLTGICGSLELRPRYLLNLGLTQLAARDWAEDILHLDLQLHQLVVSRYACRDANLVLASQEAVQGISFLRLIDRMVHALRDQFIQSTRFDPLHSGDTEQQLFDQVTRLMGSHSLQPVEIQDGRQSHRIEPTLNDFERVIGALKSDLNALLEGETNLAYAPVFASLPGFNLPAQRGLILRPEDCLSGSQRLIAQHAGADEILFISSYPCKAAPPEADAKAPPAPLPRANALLYKGLVYLPGHWSRLAETGFPIDQFEQSSGQICCTAVEALVNGTAASKASPLIAGDEIQIGDYRAQAVCLPE